MLPEFKLLRPANYPFTAAKLMLAKFLTNLEKYNPGYEMCVFL